MRNDKFLVEFVNQLTKKDIFIAVWLFGAALFSYLMWSYQKKANRRNFREVDPMPTNKSSVSIIETKKGNKNVPSKK